MHHQDHLANSSRPDEDICTPIKILLKLKKKSNEKFQKKQKLKLQKM